ncbi:MAG: phosphodiester glycosidase family protein [Clostridiales bacterium]|nr:phosphodiester glycosidase family protein [Clostridiales bacterium]
MKKILHTLKWVFLTCMSFGLACALGFFITVGCGAFPEIQSIWIGTAMTTASHKFYAEWFIPADVIENTISAGKVDDSHVESKPIVLPTEPKVDDEAEKDQKYASEGYEKLSTGVYLKKITGSTNSGIYTGYLMLCSDPSRVKLVDTDRQFVCGATVAMMIEKAGAIAGINAGGFIDGANYDSNGGSPYGIIIEDNELVTPRGGYDGTYRIIGLSPENVMTLKMGSAAWAMENGLRSAVSAEVFLIVNGEGMFKAGDGGWGIAPRTALGQRETGEIVFLAVDGRQVGYSIGCDLITLQEILMQEKCVNAAMMDGGSSTVMEYATYDVRGNCSVELINTPNLGPTLKDQRYINNAWVIMPEQQATVKDNSSHNGQYVK